MLAAVNDGAPAPVTVSETENVADGAPDGVRVIAP
jgi:hypothetical protein